MIIFMTIKYPCGNEASGGGDNGCNEELCPQPKANKPIFHSKKEKKNG